MRRISLLLPLAIAACVGLAAAPGAFAASYFESAIEHHANGDLAAAEIELDNALKASPDNVSARVLLGQVLLERGDPRAAAAELEQGLALGGDRNLILPPLAEVYLQLLQPEKVLTAIVPPGTDPRVDAELNVYQGEAALLLGDLAYAEESYTTARQLAPEDARPLVGLARVAAARRRDEVVETLLDTALAIDARSVEAWTLKGMRERDDGEFEAARESLDRALAIDPLAPKALGARAALAIEYGDEASALADVAALRQINPRDLEGIYLRSWLHVSRGETESARALLEDSAELLRTVGEDRLDKLPQVRLLFGIVSFFNHDYARAAEYFSAFLARFPRHAGAQRYLAASHLAAGDWEQVLATLEPAPGELDPDHPAALALLAEALRARGDHDRAVRYYRRAIDAAPEQVGFVLGLAASRFAAGDRDAAIESMQRLVADVPDLTEAKIQLAGMYVDAGRGAEALALAEALVAADPGDATLANLQGAVLLAEGRHGDAAEAFRRALEIDSDNVVSLVNQARLARLASRLDRAAALYESALDADPQADDAALELAQVEIGRGNIAAARTLVNRLLERRSNDVPVRIAELWLLVAERDVQTVVDALYRLDRDFPETAEALVGATRIYRAIGDREAAALMLRRARESAGFDADRLHEIAVLQLDLGDPAAAQWAITKALKGRPEHLGALGARVSAFIAQDRLDEAAAALEALRARYPERAESYTADGELLVAHGRLDAAIEAFREAHARGSNRDTLYRLFEAQIAAGEYEDAIRSIRLWILVHPEDFGSRHRLAESLIAAGAFKSARLVYEELLKHEPDNPVIYNNLAYVLQRIGDGTALDFAKRAVERAPEEAGFLDTYGWILVETGQAEIGLEVLRDAFTRQSTNDEIRYHIALALVRLERHGAARRELDAAIASERDFPSRDDALALLERLEQFDTAIQ